MIGREASSDGVVEALGEGIPLFHRKIGRVDGIEKFNDDFAGGDAEAAFLHDAMSVGASYGNDGDTCFDGHDRGALFQFLETAVWAAGALGIDQKGLAVAKGEGGFFEADYCGVAIEAVNRDEVREVKGLARDGKSEQRTFKKDGNAAGDGPDDGGWICGTGVVGGEDTGLLRDAFESLDADAYTDGTDEEHDTSDGGPVKRINVPGDGGVEKKRRADDQNVER